MYTNMTPEEIKTQILEESRLELMTEIKQGMRLEILNLHRILVERRLKRTEPSLAIRNNLLECYDMLMSESNIEMYYNLKLQRFIEKLYIVDIEV